MSTEKPAEDHGVQTPIKVAIIFSISGLGGAERSLTRMSAANSDPRIRYSLSTLGGDGDWTTWLESQGWRGRSFGIRLLRPWTLVRFIQALRRESPDIIYTVGVRVYLLIRLIRWMLPRVRIAQAIRATYPPGSTLARRYALVERMFARAEVHIANSEAGAKSFVEATGLQLSRVRVIANGVDVPTINSTGSQRTSGEVLIVANLQPRKEHIPFLEVIKVILSTHPDARFIFAGRDDMGGVVQERVRALGLDSAVEFVGYCADLEPYYNRVSLCVLPARYEEGAPTSILEAQAHALAVIAYASGGVAEIIRDGVDGLVIEDMTNASLAAGIIDLLSDDSRRRAMGRAGREKVIDRYSLAACADKHAEVWRTLIAQDADPAA